MALTVFLTISIPGAEAPIQSPTVRYVRPNGVQPGEVAEITVVGEHLEGTTHLWTEIPVNSDGHLPAPIDNSASQVTFRFKIDSNLPPGIVAFQLATTNGLSNYHFILIEDLSLQISTGTNRLRHQAEILHPPIAIEGNCEELKSRFFRFHAIAAQVLTFEVVAARIGSRLDPVMRLLTSTGRELEYCDDAPGLGADARLVHTFAEDGDYLIELRDARLTGSDQHRYHLRVGSFPAVTASYPLAVEPDRETLVQPVGPDGDVGPPLKCYAQSPVRRLDRALKSPGDNASAFLPLSTSRLPEVLEQEPNDLPETATPIIWPVAVEGRFRMARDRDYFQFTARAEERLSVRGQTRTLGSPCDLFMRLLHPGGATAVDADITTTPETKLDYTFKSNGTYRLLVEEANGFGGPDLVYRLEIDRASFALQLDTHRVRGASGDSFSVKVSCDRQGFTGPITLQLSGETNGFQVLTNRIESKATNGVLTATIPGGLAAGSFRHFRIRGEAEVSGTHCSIPARATRLWREQFPQLPRFPIELEDLVGLGIVGAVP